MNRRNLFPVVAALLIGAVTAQAQHLGDVQISAVDHQLVTNDENGVARVYLNEFDDFSGILFTDDPGFESQMGSLPGGAPIGFNVTQSLWYWDGKQLAPPPESAFIKIGFGPAPPVFVTGESGAQAGFTFATSSSSGAIHTHLSYTLAPNDTAFGVYGVVLQLTSPQLEASDPFLIAFNYGLTDLDQIFDGVDAILDASGILDPPAVPGDTNADGVVDVADLNNVRNNFGAAGDPIPGDTAPFDGAVDIQDLNRVRNNFGAVANAVPEPAALALMLVAWLPCAPRLLAYRR